MSQTLIFSLSQQDANVELLARDLAQEFAARPSQLHVELASIICYCCKVPSFPQRMIENGDLTAIETFLRQWFKPSSEKARYTVKDLLSLELWPNVLNFFHHLINCEWDLLSGATHFDSFFTKFLSVLTYAELPALRYLGTAIQLEFVAVCSIERIELLQDAHRNTIIEFTKSILMNSFHDYERKIWEHSLSQMRQWFLRNDFLVEENLMKFLIWGLSDRLITNSHFCLQISVELLDRHHERKPSLTKFIHSLVRILTPGLATEDMKLFVKLCDLAVVLYNKYQDIGLCKKFLDILFRFTFAAERAKAKAAAIVFLRTKLQNYSPFEQLRSIVQFLAPQNSVFVELFVDAMIDDCQLLTKWDALADALRQLTEMSEQETLLLVILCVVSLIINDEKPFIRDEKNEIQPANDFRAAMTSVFAPLLLNTLSNENASFRWKLLVVKIAMYFDFDHVQRAHKATVLHEYVNTFEGATSAIFDVVQTTTMLQLVIAILQHDRLETIDHAIINLKTGFEREFVNLVCRLPQYELKDFTPSMNVVIGMYACRNIMQLDEKCLFDIPVQLLQEELKSDNILLCFCHEMAIMLSSDYVLELLSKSDSSASEDGLDPAQIDRIKVVFPVICECLNQQYYSRIGELAFFSLCRMVKTLFSANVSESQRNSIFTDVISNSLCAYVALALRNIQLAQLPSYEFSTYSLENIIAQFSDLILSDILPLAYAYEFLHAHCHQTSKLEKELRRFLLQVVDRKSSHEVAQWIVNYFAEYFRIADEDLLNNLVVRAKCLGQLLQSMRNSMVDVLKFVHKLGIDFAVSRIATKGGLESVKFLFILVELSPCLLAKTKEMCYKYFERKQIVGHVNVAKLYYNSLRVRKKQSAVDDAESTSSEESHEFEPEARISRPSFADSNLSEPESRRSRSSIEDSSPALSTRSFRSRQSQSNFS